MKIIISPAKKIKKDAELLFDAKEPVFIEQTKKLIKHIQTLSYSELKAVLVCNDDIAQLNYERYQNMDLEHGLHHALLAYDGIQYQYMAPLVFDIECFEYVSKHLRILSGLYGVLHPLDALQPYRLEMQAKLKTPFCKDLYEFWDNSIAKELSENENLIVNLASKEYSKIVEKHLSSSMQFVTCSFFDINKKTGKLVEKGVYVKMARGEMVRFMAENKILDINGLKSFSGLGFKYEESLSNENFVAFTR